MGTLSFLYTLKKVTFCGMAVVKGGRGKILKPVRPKNVQIQQKIKYKNPK